MNGEKFLEYLRVICYLKSRSPEYIKAKEIAEKFFNGSEKKVEACAKALKEAHLVDSVSGANGGYTYSPNFKKDDILGRSIDPYLKSLTFDNTLELNKINLSIQNNDTIDRLKELTFGGLTLISNMKFEATLLSKKEEKIMLDVADAIRDKHKIKVKYVASSLTIDNKINIYEIILCPISFYIFNGSCYLNAYYETTHNGKGTGIFKKRTYVLNRIDENNIIHIDNEHFEINEDDLKIIKNKLPYEIYSSDEELKFKIRLSFRGYNCFNRTFKNYYSESIDYKSPYSIIEIKTKSYLECMSNLLNLGDTFEFVNIKESKKVGELYINTIKNLSSKY